MLRNTLRTFKTTKISTFLPYYCNQMNQIFPYINVAVVNLNITGDFVFVCDFLIVISLSDCSCENE